MKKNELGITASKEKDMPEWYGQVVIKSELVDYAPVKGCMVIRPYGYSLWQSIMDYFNKRLEKIGVDNAYFPLFIPESFFKKEAEHAKGFSPEVAWLSRKDEESGERLALRPTSETIIYDSYSRWIRSWRDLPLKINQWCNIIRWEVSDVKLFLRSREFLWQEGHCVYETEEECDKEVLRILKEYEDMAKNLLALPVITGKKTDKEKFAGAEYTMTIEAFMPDGKALQCGTTHNLGTGFAKTFNISYLGRDEKKHTPWQSSWGVSTRLIGAMVMTHSDDKGLVLPPNIAPVKAVIIPIFQDKTKEKVIKKSKELQKKLLKKKGFAVRLDDREGISPGFKFHEWELKGIPLRIEIGPRDIESGQAILVRRDNGKKTPVKINDLSSTIDKILDNMQACLFDKAKKRLEDNTVKADSWEEFIRAIGEKKLVLAPFSGDGSDEEKIKEKTGATARCIPLSFLDKKSALKKSIEGKRCVISGKPAKTYAYFSKSY